LAALCCLVPGCSTVTAVKLQSKLLTQDAGSIPFDHEFAAQTEFGRPFINRCPTLAPVTDEEPTSINERNTEAK